MREALRSVSGLAALVAVGACGELPPITSVDREVARIAFVSNPCSSVAIGETCAIRAQARDSADLPIAGVRLFWSSTNTGVASVAGAGDVGTVSGRRSGTTTIRVTADNGVVATVGVRVPPLH